MLNTQDITSLRGSDVLDRDGDKIGKLDEVYLDDETGRPEFGLVSGGLFGGSHFVPLAQASLEGGALRVPYEKGLVKDAPGVSADEHLSQQQEAELYAHYGLSYGESRSDSGLPEGGRGRTDDIVSADTRAVGRDTSGPTTDQAMTRSEEELRVGTQRREAGRARLRKWVTTETVSETVPVQREEVRVEREAITDANIDNAMAGPEISEEEHEITLMEEQPVVEKRAVPKERVRLDKQTITDQEQVSGEVRKEHIDVDGDDDIRRR
jgi:uncharacterized protein (TIGR02271 family)